MVRFLCESVQCYSESEGLCSCDQIGSWFLMSLQNNNNIVVVYLPFRVRMSKIVVVEHKVIRH